MIIDHSKLNWHKSSYSAEGAQQCIEVSDETAAAALFVRDSKQADGPVFAVSAGAWGTFVAFAAASA